MNTRILMNSSKKLKKKKKKMHQFTKIKSYLTKDLKNLYEKNISLYLKIKNKKKI